MDIDHKWILSELIDSYYSSIWAYVYARTNNYHVANDLTQEVYVRALAHLGKFRKESSHKTWLYTIARNVCTDHARSFFTRRVIPADHGWFELRASGSPTSGYESDVMDIILSDELWAQIFKLPVKQREVVLLHLKEDLTFREIAEIVQAKEVTVRARYQRGIKRLREMQVGGDDDDV